MALKMYILILESIDLGHAILAAAHGSLGGYLTFISPVFGPETTVDQIDKFNDIKNESKFWVEKSFRKVVCKVTPSEFEKAKEYGTNMMDYRIMTESGLGGMETAIVFAPKDDWPPFFKSLKLYK